MIKVIRLKTIKGGGSMAAFVASNITVVKPCRDNNSIVCTTGDTKGLEVYESTDQIEQMITMETIGIQPQQPNPINYPQLDHE